MITIQSGKLTIPEEDRFVGFAGDNLGSIKRFVLPSHGSDSGSYSLCLRFDDDSVRVIPLTKSLSGSDLVLTWTIQSIHLLKAGVVMAQVKSVDSDDVIIHTSCDYFIVASSAELAVNGDPEYVVRAELEERMTAILGQIRDSAPYIGEDGYWYVYDVESAAYVRDIPATPQFTVDNTVILGSTNPVAGGAVKAYVDSGLDTKANKATTVAGLPLSANISRADLVEQISGLVNPPLIVQGTTLGYSGQYGKTLEGAPMMCVMGNTWKELATADGVAGKMDLAPNVSWDAIDDLTAGQLFFCQAGVAVKNTNGYTELARANNVYSKSEIDAMIGNLETALNSI